MKEQLIRVGRAFRIDGDMASYEEIKIGLVNQTYKPIMCLPTVNINPI